MVTQLRSFARRLWSSLLSLSFLLAIGCPGSGPVDAGQADLDAGFDAGAPLGAEDAGPQAWWPLDGTDPDLATDDLQPLAALLQEAQIVGIGESVHTTGGELRMRARIIRFMVAELGFRVIALENEWDLTERGVAPYVEGCEGTAEGAAMAINPIWWDRSTPALLEWLCAFNEAHPSDPVVVVGVDIRQAWWDHPAITTYLEQTAPEQADSLSSGLSTCLGVGFADHLAFFADPEMSSYFNGTPTPQADHEACITGADAALELFEDQRETLIAASSEREYERARVRVVGMRAFDLSIFHLSRGQIDQAGVPRDAAMADVFLTFRHLDFPDAKAIVFAHNGHVLSRSDEVTVGVSTPSKNLGSLIEDEVGEAYAAVGQLSRRAHIDWHAGPQTLFHGSADDLEQQLNAVGPAFLLVDTQAAVGLEPQLWTPETAYDVGFDTLVPTNHFRALVFHRESPANDYFTAPPFGG